MRKKKQIRTVGQRQNGRHYQNAFLIDKKQGKWGL